MKSLRRWVVLGSVLVLGAFVIHGCGGDDKKNPVNPPGGADVTITISGQNGNMSFSPNPATVDSGQTVSWRNNDATTHTSTSNASGWNTGNIGGGSTSSPIQMNTPGSFPYHCNIHPTMTGTLTVNP